MKLNEKVVRCLCEKLSIEGTIDVDGLFLLPGKVWRRSEEIETSC